MSTPTTDEQNAQWQALRIEANNPTESTKWKCLWSFDKQDWVKNQELIDELNVINAPVQLRIVPNVRKNTR